MTKINKKRVLIIPIKDENHTIIKKIIKESKKYVNHIILVDDGSKKKLRCKGCRIIRNDTNKGKGFSLIKGFNLVNDLDYDFVYIMDGDGEHDPRDLPKFEKQINEYDLVIGYRGKKRSVFRNFINKWQNYWISILIPYSKQKKLKLDSSCGYRLIRKKLLNKLDLKSTGFTIDIEIILESIKNNAKISSVNINPIIIKKTGVAFRDYIEINNFYDRWVLRNISKLKIGVVKKLYLLVCVIMGLSFGSIIRWISHKH